MSVWNTKNEGELKAVQSLAHESDRSAAIIAATFVEDRLQQGLECRFRRDAVARPVTEELFRIAGPLGSFSAKIRLGFLLRLYGQLGATQARADRAAEDALDRIIKGGEVINPGLRGRYSIGIRDGVIAKIWRRQAASSTRRAGLGFNSQYARGEQVACPPRKRPSRGLRRPP